MSGGLAARMSAELGTAVASRLGVLEPAGVGMSRRHAAELRQIRQELLRVVEMWRRLLLYIIQRTAKAAARAAGAGGVADGGHAGCGRQRMPG